MSTALAALLDDVRCQIRGMLVKGVVRLVTEATGLRVLQVTGRAWDETTPETWPDAQHWEPAGLTGRAPVKGETIGGAECRTCPEALVLQLSPDLAIVAQVVDRQARPADQEPGETGLYDLTPRLVNPDPLLPPNTPMFVQQRIRMRPGIGIAIVAPYGCQVTGTFKATATVEATTGYRTNYLGAPVAGKTSTYADPAGNTLIFAGGILVGGTGAP